MNINKNNIINVSTRRKSNLTTEQKKEMKKQAVNLAQKLNKGSFLTKTLKEINFR